jgi:hypothetical protein
MHFGTKKRKENYKESLFNVKKKKKKKKKNFFFF